MTALFSQLYWREPLWLLLALVPLVLIIWQKFKQKSLLNQYADPKLQPWIIVPSQTTRPRRSILFQFLIWLLLALAAAGPRLLNVAPDNVLPPKASAVIILDHSRSMLADDVYPNRLQQANATVKKWLQETQQLNLGVIIFAGASHVVMPPNNDPFVFQKTVQLLDKVQLPTHGSAFLSALKQAVEQLNGASGSRGIVVLTDGDFSTANFPAIGEMIAQLYKKKITLNLLGVGKVSKIALKDGNGGWLLQNDQAITTRLNEMALRKLAAENAGVKYHRLNLNTHQNLENVWQPPTAKIDDQYLEQVLWNELFAWFLTPALILILISHFQRPRITISSLIVVTMALIGQPATGTAGTQNLKQAYAAWQKNDFQLAATLYSKVAGYEARMGQGASCFRGEEVVCAITAFTRAAWIATNAKQRGVAAFNLGNSYFKQGDFISAITLFKDALTYQPEQLQYQQNLNFSEEVQRQIELRLKQEAASANRGAAGAGVRAINVENNTVVTPNMRLTLDKNPVNLTLAQTNAINLSESQLAEFMQRSQMFASASSTQGEIRQVQHDWQRFSNEDPTVARQLEFWQRLFEMEEGILTHPETPKLLPGVPPW